jgi:hypothetical protein
MFPYAFDGTQKTLSEDVLGGLKQILPPDEPVVMIALSI